MMDVNKKKVLVRLGSIALLGIVGVSGYGIYKIQNPTPQELSDAGKIEVLEHKKEPKMLTEDEIQELQEQGVIAKSAEDTTKEDERLNRMKLEKNNESNPNENNSGEDPKGETTKVLDWENMTEEEIYANRTPAKLTKSKEEKNKLKQQAKSFYTYIQNNPENPFWEYDVFKNFVEDYEKFEQNDSAENAIALQESLGAVAGSFKNIGLIS